MHMTRAWGQLSLSHVCLKWERQPTKCATGRGGWKTHQSGMLRKSVKVRCSLSLLMGSEGLGNAVHRMIVATKQRVTPVALTHFLLLSQSSTRWILSWLHSLSVPTCLPVCLYKQACLLFTVWVGLCQSRPERINKDCQKHRRPSFSPNPAPS